MRARDVKTKQVQHFKYLGLVSREDGKYDTERRIWIEHHIAKNLSKELRTRNIYVRS